MKRVLVYGYKAVPFGGVERVLQEYIKTIMESHSRITFDILVAGDTCAQEAFFRELNCRVLYFPHRGRNAKAYRERLQAIFSATAYDAVWCNVSGLTNIDVLMMAKSHGVPVRVVHSHVIHLMWGNPLMRVLVPLMHYRNKLRLAKYATHYWACSQAAGEFMFPASVHDQIYVVKNAVDTDVYRPRPDLRDQICRQYGLNGLVVGHIARLSEEKNQKFLLQIMRQVVDRDPEARLFLVGDGDQRKALEEETARLGLQEHVIFTGFRRDIDVLLQRMDVFMLPSVAEGLGLSAIEAQACGVPCVVSDAVPQEVDISGAVRFLPLDAPLAQWADAVFQMTKVVIESPTQCVQKSGYQISVTAADICKVLMGE